MIRIHFCPLDRECRQYGAPARLHISTPRKFIIIAFTPNARMQLQDADGMYRDRWGWWDIRDRER